MIRIHLGSARICTSSVDTTHGKHDLHDNFDSTSTWTARPPSPHVRLSANEIVFSRRDDGHALSRFGIALLAKHGPSCVRSHTHPRTCTRILPQHSHRRMQCKLSSLRCHAARCLYDLSCGSSHASRRRLTSQSIHLTTPKHLHDDTHHIPAPCAPHDPRRACTWGSSQMGPCSATW